jgi:hypothetical protein
LHISWASKLNRESEHQPAAVGCLNDKEKLVLQVIRPSCGNPPALNQNIPVDTVSFLHTQLNSQHVMKGNSETS